MTCFKNNHKLQTKSQTKVFSGGDTYNITSTVFVPLNKDDMLSFVHCEVKQKSTLILQKNISLSQYLRGKSFLFVWLSQCRVGMGNC